jgi:hypothetical protein
MSIVGAIPSRLCALTVVALQACAQEEPAHVYVPADDYVISVQIALPAEARAGEWTRLSAQRRSGPWKRIPREEAPAGFVPFVKPPPEFESEVADNLFWMTEPPGARFDVPAMQPHHRFVLFPKPGTYQVWARSAYPTDAKSNVVTIRVR